MAPPRALLFVCMHQFKVHKYLGVFPTVYFRQLEVEGDFIVISDFGGVLWLVNSQAVGVVGVQR